MKVWICDEDSLEIYNSEEAARAAYEWFCKIRGIKSNEERFYDCYRPVEVWGINDYNKQFE